MTIRAYEPADLGAVAVIWLSGWESTGVMAPGTSGTVTDLAKRLPVEIAGGWAVYVADVGGEVVGFCALAGDKLKQLFVTPIYQGRGLGKALLDFVKQARPDGFTLSTAVNSRAWAFYEREGLVRIGEKAHARFGFPMYRYAWPSHRP